MKKYIYFLFVAFAIVACSRYPADVKRALELSGDNRAELEKVLEHYKDDPLKYNAAVFLIGNMPRHYSYINIAYLNSYYNELDSGFVITQNADEEIKDSMYRQIREKYPIENLKVVSDVKIIKANYLMDNIEHAFSLWQNGQWATHLNFADFCEYLLPYKVCETQILENWRFYFDNFAADSLEKISYCKLYKHSVLKACEVINNELNHFVKPRYPIEFNNFIPIRRMSNLIKIPWGTCEDYVYLAATVMRSNGIPIAIDFTPQWPFRSLGHSWDVVFDNTWDRLVFEACRNRPGMHYKDDHIYAKIYRKTYSVNREIEKINATEAYVPAVFRDMFIKDVTRDYVSTVDVQMKITNSNSSKYAYLSVFNDRTWEPVCWGKISFGKVTFKDIGKDVIYLPVVMNVNGLTPFSTPVIVDRNGKLTYMKADTVNRQTMTLNRKYPVLPQVYKIMERIVGGQIQASNHPDFKDYTVLHTIQKYGVTAEDIVLDNPGEYRYWRYFSPPGSHGNIAELVFYGRESNQPVKGEIIGSPGYNKDGMNGKEAAFDGDALTNFEAPDSDNNWVGMDFGKPISINRIYYLPRSDGNLIEIGDDYELFYWTNHQWKSLGQQQATGSRLIFEDCPSNGLYLLRDHTKGKEERIFTYENNEQVWW